MLHCMPTTQSQILFHHHRSYLMSEDAQLKNSVRMEATVFFSTSTKLSCNLRTAIFYRAIDNLETLEINAFFFKSFNYSCPHFPSITLPYPLPSSHIQFSPPLSLSIGPLYSLKCGRGRGIPGE